MDKIKALQKENDRLLALTKSYQQTEADLQYHIAFEDLVTQISTNFIKLKPDEIDAGINDALRKIGEFSGVDRSYIHMYSEDYSTFTNTHEWCASGIKPVMHLLQNVPAQDEWAFATDALVNGEVIHIPSVNSLPPELNKAKQSLIEHGVKSLIAVPMMFRNRAFGEVAFDSVHSEKKWSDDSIILLRVIGEIFVNAFERKNSEEKLAESQRRLSTLMSNLPGMAYRCSIQPGWPMEFISQGCFALTGYKPEDLIEGQKITYARLVHTDDRPDVLSKISDAIDNKDPFHLTYRIITSDKREKWVWDQGVGVYSAKGEVIAMEGFITDFTDQKTTEIELITENRRLKSSVQERYRLGNIIGKARSMQDVYQLILMAAASEENVVIYGESGTGKELVARAIHEMSKRSENKFMPVNCGAIPENLLESEFFGHKKGAFTGAVSDNKGYFDIANGGTLFMDEIGEISLNMQVKLLRAIEGGGYTPVGSNQVKKPDFRIIAASNKNLVEHVKKGFMRKDFFYRLNIIPINLPPLRERKEDIPLLVDHFLKKHADHTPKISSKAFDAFYKHDWPGNVRELENVLKRFLTTQKIEFFDTQTGQTISSNDILEPDLFEETAELREVLNRFERQYILKILKQNSMHKGKTAKMLGIPERTFYRKLKQFKPKMT